MDSITHALFGSACAIAVTHRTARNSGDIRRRVVVAAASALFPDIDYLGFWIDPLIFLADWHRSFTHSLLLIPLWAGVVTLFFMVFQSYRTDYRALYLISCLAIASHILLDLTTVYGTAILYPLLDVRFSFSISFVIDWILTSTLIVSLLIYYYSHARMVIIFSLLLIGGYWYAQYLLKNHALEVAGRELSAVGTVFAVPQPFSPFNWKIIRQDGVNYQLAYFNLLAETEEGALFDPFSLRQYYKPVEALIWKSHYLYGDNVLQQNLIKEAWEHPEFNYFRSFASLPVHYRLDQSNGKTCVWFTDIRYALPFLPPSFRYGLCRSQEDDDWKLFRLALLGEEKIKLYY